MYTTVDIPDVLHQFLGVTSLHTKVSLHTKPGFEILVTPQNENGDMTTDKLVTKELVLNTIRLVQKIMHIIIL